MKMMSFVIRLSVENPHASRKVDGIPRDYNIQDMHTDDA